MKLTATNGNARNKIEGQRVTLTTDRGVKFHKCLPAGNALRRVKYQSELIDFVHTVGVLEGWQRIPRRASVKALAMLDLFARAKARLVVVHGRRGIL